MKTGPKAKGWSRGQLARLACDTTGNAMLMMAAAMLPIIGMAGSAFDMGRAYMVKSRLQQACDAGALAGRRAMTAADFDDDTVAKQEANKFFHANFPEGSFGVGNISFTPKGSVDSNSLNDGQVTARASATVPMTLMKVFNVPTLTMAAACDARLELANTDVMFVLDVTGSMDQTLPGGTAKKIVGLRAAVIDFYKILDGAASKSSRLRFGFTPYSSGVNVGKLLLDLNPAYLADKWSYQTRDRWWDGSSYNEPNTTTTSWQTTSSTTSGWEDVVNQINSKSTCQNMDGDIETNYENQTSTKTGETVVDDVKTSIYKETRTRVRKEYDTNWSGGKCTVKVQTTRSEQERTVTVVLTPDYTWKYARIERETDQYKQFVSGVTYRIGNNYSNKASAQWSGCVEERRTLPEPEFEFGNGVIKPKGAGSKPDDLLDLEIDAKPGSANDTKWGPAWREMVFTRAAGTTEEFDDDDHNQPGTACPRAARRLATMTQSEVQTYVDSLSPTGSTYHDLGMLWGTRMMSLEGVFGPDHTVAPNGRDTNRHIVFMTDGIMEPSYSTYSMYGYEYLDQRVSGGTPSNSDLANRHHSRFLAICAAAKAKGITVWAVAYGLTVTPQLQACADPGKSFTAANDAELKKKFQLIASKIAELRIAK
ncbi:pilus assembly protein TadG-related protein [Sphingomonas sp. LaA6.9]|uniref:pilus assembly protein TadG-related protein n=1 Tax=Sphingomonas sp. LaA6.9 TaxID=2919914 RepID=UPI001F4F790C|nr:pilus assembly protein TadG-related protein [Sphingomonas sp. LaA6.9]MCJ8156195.1 pilus assembly protein TadG-related protein [Sphingomonas sp. LaA6.9]